MKQLRVWSTEDVAPSARAAWWRAIMDRQFNGLETDLYGDSTCNGRLVVNDVSGVTLARLHATRHRVVKSDQAPTDAGAQLKIVAPFYGDVWVEQHNRVAHANPGEWIIYDTGCEYSVANPSSVDHLVVMVPRTLLHDSDINLKELVAQPMGVSGMGRVALQTMRSTFAELPSMQPVLRSAAGEAVAHLVRLSLLESAGQQCERSHQSAMRERIQAYVMRNLNDPDLSIERIATALRCSKRLLHTAFQGSGQTLNAYIQTQRLEACARDLSNPQLHHWPIMQIAASRGFSNASHFSRSFREHLGMTPREWRNQRGRHNQTDKLDVMAA